jgi:hypothetical protein
MMVATDDYVDILDLYATYNHLADGDDAVAYGDCYSFDGSLRSGGRDIGHSRAEIIEFRRKNIAGRESRVRRHFTSNVRLKAMSSKKVMGESYMQAFDFRSGSEARMTHSGTYKDVLVKTDGRWLFSSRELTFDFVAD